MSSAIDKKSAAVLTAFRRPIAEVTARLRGGARPDSSHMEHEWNITAHKVA